MSTKPAQPWSQAESQAGFSGIPNPLFARDNTVMLFGRGKQSMQETVAGYKESR
jgi:NAD(P) transhydrogenase subunit beta